MNAFWVFLISFPHNCAFSLQHPTGNSPTVNSPTVKPVRVKKKKGATILPSLCTIAKHQTWIISLERHSGKKKTKAANWWSGYFTAISVKVKKDFLLLCRWRYTWKQWIVCQQSTCLSVLNHGSLLRSVTRKKSSVAQDMSLRVVSKQRHSADTGIKISGLFFLFVEGV